VAPPRLQRLGEHLTNLARIVDHEHVHRSERLIQGALDVLGHRLRPANGGHDVADAVGFPESTPAGAGAPEEAGDAGAVSAGMALVPQFTSIQLDPARILAGSRW